ncbi:MAG: peptidase M28, partial [Sphingomonas sp.]|nr:peptidase M28 [Sphingomonas sp.]
MDFGYLSKVTAINVATLARLAAAPAAPAGVSIAGALGRDTNVKWSATPGATGYRLHWRRADRQDWSDQRDIPGGVTTTVLKDVPVDDHFVGVSAIGANGAESLISFAGRAPAK